MSDTTQQSIMPAGLSTSVLPIQTWSITHICNTSKPHPCVVAWSVATEQPYADVNKQLLPLIHSWALKNDRQSSQRLAIALRRNQRSSSIVPFGEPIPPNVSRQYAGLHGWHRTSLRGFGEKHKFTLSYSLLRLTKQDMVAQTVHSGCVAIIDGHAVSLYPLLDHPVSAVYTRGPLRPRTDGEIAASDVLSVLAATSVQISAHT